MKNNENIKINNNWFDFEIYTIQELIVYEATMIFLSFVGCLFFEHKQISFFFFLKRLTLIVITRPFFIGLLRINKIKDKRISNALSQGIFVIILAILSKYSKFFI
ncbi:MAG: hypothetical protein AM1032_000161 [Mycoplasmataceae bacterium]|nr:MAG: hypothetical protein AM1032_000161 [Mycoplasmataceae bacterium]